jgi:hypothetical protein
VNRRGCVANVEEGIARAEEIGFPVMIKASEGKILYCSEQCCGSESEINAIAGSKFGSEKKISGPQHCFQMFFVNFGHFYQFFKIVSPPRGIRFHAYNWLRVFWF